VHAQADGNAAFNFGKQFFPHVFMWEINFREKQLLASVIFWVNDIT
jgi:hypothetical protein